MIALIYDNEKQRADLGFNGKTLTLDEGLDTDTVISLFTDAPWRPGDRVPASGNIDKRGCWMDAITEEEGSRLWTLEGAKMDALFFRDAKSIIEDALSHRIRYGIAKEVNVLVSQHAEGMFIEIYTLKPDGTVHRWAGVWKATLDAV